MTLTTSRIMQMGYALFLVLFPICLEGCCVRNHQMKKRGHKQKTMHQHYRAVEGETFMVPCSSPEEHWKKSRMEGDGEDDEEPSFECGKAFQVEAKHSGNYTDRTGNSNLTLRLQIVQKISTGCFQPEENIAVLITGVGGNITCPGLNCSDNSNVVWYKGNKSMSEWSRAFCNKGGLLHLCTVSEYDSEVFFCDRQIKEHGFTWTFRRAVNVKAIPEPKQYPPRIMCPDGNITEEVELGQPHTLTCKAYFPFELHFSPKVWWHMNNGSSVENMALEQNRVIHEENEVIRRAVIKEVTPQHLKDTYTCRASNTFGNSSVTVKLKRRIKVKWPCLVGYPLGSFLLVTGLGIILHVKWLELKLIYRSRFHFGKPDGVGKEFDVFLSYVWSPSSVEGLSLSIRSGPCSSEEVAACLPGINMNRDEGQAPCTSLEVLLTQVLESQWGYRLCLLERDMLPGGAFTNDVVLALKRSRMLICVLSADYLSNSDAVFVLESGIQALLQTSALKLLLIWNNRASATHIQPEPPLPALVHRALKVLPSLDLSSDQPAGGAVTFWRALKKAVAKCRE